MADICIMSLNDNGATYYYRSSLAYNPTFSLPANGEYSVCITYPGAIAYVKYVGENAIHIQNRTLSGDSQITSRNVYFGRDVLRTKPQGPVAVIKGKTEVKATNSVLLKNSFEVLQGAEFSVEIEN